MLSAKCHDGIRVLVRRDKGRFGLPANMLEQASPGACQRQAVRGSTEQDVHQSAETVSVLAGKERHVVVDGDGVPAFARVPREALLALPGSDRRV